MCPALVLHVRSQTTPFCRFATVSDRLESARVIQAGHDEKKHGRWHRSSGDGGTQKRSGQAHEHKGDRAYPLQRDEKRDAHPQTDAGSRLEERSTPQEERRNQYERSHTALPDELVHQEEIGELRSSGYQLAAH